jgi:anti-sigma regulatory factor (Ser/Thr protein kinase)
VRALPITHLDARLPNRLSSAPRARAAISRAIRESPVGDRRPDFVLAMGEAINNAIEHGSRFPLDTVHVRLEWDETGIRGSVESNGAWRETAPALERGRGLTIMRALADRVEIDATPKGTTVRLGLDAPHWQTKTLANSIF